MARIPDEELRRIKSQVQVEDLCRGYGIELKRMGPDTLMGLCPFHEDHDPSFGVTPSKNLWNCLAGCGGGDVIQLVMKKEDVSFRRAVELLREGRGAGDASGVYTRRWLDSPIRADGGDAEALGQVVEYYPRRSSVPRQLWSICASVGLWMLR